MPSKSAFIGYPKPDRLLQYQKRYQAFHVENPKRLSGKMYPEQIKNIAKLVKWLRTARDWVEFKPDLLDYGSGKGYQYLAERVHDQWGGILPTCYDPGVIQLGARPTGKFDGIICTDVMEHIETEDVPDVLQDIFNYVHPNFETFVYFQICCRPAGKSFTDGTNLHATLEPPAWWQKQIALCAAELPFVKVVATYEGYHEELRPDQDFLPEKPQEQEAVLDGCTDVLGTEAEQ